MKLFYIEGNNIGASFELTPPGASIGRETDNDIILKSDASSRYNSKLEFRDGEWFLRDLGSTNGTKLNDEKISSETRLHEGDRIKIGNEVLFFGTSLNPKFTVPDITSQPAISSIQEQTAGIKPESPTVAFSNSESLQEDGKSLLNPRPSVDSGRNGAKGKAKSPDDELQDKGNVNKMDFFAKKKLDKSENKTKHASTLFYVFVIAAAVILVFLFLLFDRIQNESEKNKKPQPVAKQNAPPLMVSYEKQISTPDNIFRYELKIRDDTITVTRDDLKHQIKFTRGKKVDREAIQKLEQDLKETKFMDLSEQQSGIASDGTDELKVLTIAFGNNLNSVRIKNTFEPTSFNEAVKILEEFSENVLSIPTISLTADEMKNKAAEEFRNAEMLFKNYQSKGENLRLAIKKYGLVVDYLECFEPKPEMYDKAYQHSQEAKKILDDEIRDDINDAKTNYRLGRYDDAREKGQSAISKMDPDDNRYEHVKDLIIDCDRKLKPNKKK